MTSEINPDQIKHPDIVSPVIDEAAERTQLNQMYELWRRAQQYDSEGAVVATGVVEAARSGRVTELLEAVQGFLILTVMDSDTDAPMAAYHRTQAATRNLAPSLLADVPEDDVLTAIMDEARIAVDNPIHIVSEQPSETDDTEVLTPAPPIEDETLDLATISNAQLRSLGLREEELFMRVRQGDRQARERLVIQYMPFARLVASRYIRPTEKAEDLIQVANVGLIEAVDRFDPERGEFVAFAGKTILGKLRRYFRDNVWGMHVPRGLKEQALAVKSYINVKEQQGEDYDFEELAGELGMSETEAYLAWTAWRYAYQPGSLDAPVSDRAEDPADSITLHDQVEDPTAIEAYEVHLREQELTAAIDQLEPRLRVIILKGLEGWTQTRIGQHLGFSQMHISREMRKAVEQLSTILGYEE